VHLPIRLATRQDTAKISEVLREAARWLEQSGMAMCERMRWFRHALRLMLNAGLFFIAECDSEAARVVKFKLEDQQFWADVDRCDSAFVHRLTVTGGLHAVGFHRLC
jgi:hypothetical protein